MVARAKVSCSSGADQRCHRCVDPFLPRISPRVGSTTGHLVYPRGNAYNATKFAQRNAYVVPKEEN